MRNVYNILDGKPEGKKKHGRENIKINLKKISYRGVD
jgi:hypothetical protein